MEHTPRFSLTDPDLAGNERRYLLDAFDSGFLSHHGKYEALCENAIGRLLGKPALLTSSGTGALHLALLAYRIGHGDEVIVPDLTFGATASAVLAVGATPVPVDVSHETWGLDHELVERAITRKTKAILPVHLYGMDAGDFSDFGLPVIEDACEAFGIVPPRAVSCYSFYANKVLTCGEGGAITGDYLDAEDWRNGGFDASYAHTVAGLNYRITNLQAAVLLAQLERFDYLVGRRLSNSDYYAAHLEGKGKWMFCLRCNPEDKPPVETRPIFTPLHLQTPFHCAGKFPVSEWIWKNHLCIPTGTKVDAVEITRRIEEWQSRPMRNCKPR